MKYKLKMKQKYILQILNLWNVNLKGNNNIFFISLNVP